MVRDYASQGLSLDRCFSITGLTKNQYYYKQSGNPRGKRPSTTTLYKDKSRGDELSIDNTSVVRRIVDIKLDPDHANYYKLITKTLCLEGYYINHKKVYRLMFEHLLLEDRKKQTGKKYVQYRRVAPSRPLEVIEMDIKYVWLYEKKKYAFVLTVIDTFTRYVLHWSVGLQMKTSQVKEVWEYVIAHYIQPYLGLDKSIEVEVRSDNGKQFSSREIISFFEDNYLNQVHTHPYTPEENGHVESFHKTLGKAISRDRFTTLQSLETRLNNFYLSYNNKRAHGSILGLPPAIFWALVELKKINVAVNQEERRTKCTLKVAYQDIMCIPKVNQYKYRVLRS
jgi:transposase InsO family protein